MIVLTSTMERVLRQASLYGYLVERKEQLYHPGGNHAVCSKGFAMRMVEGGWLTIQGQRYEPSPDALRRA